MTKSSKSQSPAPDQRDVYAEAVAAQAKAVRMNARMLEKASALTFGMVDFMNRRLGEDIAATNALGQCNSIEAAFKTLGEFQKKALEDYAYVGASLQAQTVDLTDTLREDAAEADAPAARPRAKAKRRAA